MEKGINVTATFDSFDAAVLSEMKGTILDTLEDPWVGHHDYKESLKDVDSFLRVVDWYSRPDEYKAFLNEIQSSYDSLVAKAFPEASSGKLSFTVSDIRDLPDGSAIMEYEASSEMKEFLMKVGLTQVLLDACESVLEGGLVPGWEYYEEEQPEVPE